MDATGSADGALWEREMVKTLSISVSLVSSSLFSRCLSSKATLSSLIEWTVPVEQPEMCLPQGHRERFL